MEGLRLVSRQFRKQRLAVWAAGRGPDPHFTAMVKSGKTDPKHKMHLVGSYVQFVVFPFFVCM